MLSIQLTENNSYINSTSSHEKSPSELRTPKTISEDSFTKENKENIKVKINKTKKNQKKKLINNSHNIKLRLNNQNLFGFIPSIKKAFVKNNKILNSNDKSRSKYEEKTELIHHVKKIYKKKIPKKIVRRIILKILLKQKMYIKMKLKKMEKYFLN